MVTRATRPPREKSLLTRSGSGLLTASAPRAGLPGPVVGFFPGFGSTMQERTLLRIVVLLPPRSEKARVYAGFRGFCGGSASPSGVMVTHCGPASPLHRVGNDTPGGYFGGSVEGGGQPPLYTEKTKRVLSVYIYWLIRGNIPW